MRPALDSDDFGSGIKLAHLTKVTLTVTATDVERDNTVAIKPLKMRTATRGMASTMRKAAHPGFCKP